MSKPRVFVLAAARTPVASFGSLFKSIPGTKLGSIAISGALKQANVSPNDVEEVYMGNVVSANTGQAPARQAALGAGCPIHTEATTVNKVCASGLKAVTMATQALWSKDRSLMVAGGMESMSNVPYYVNRGLQYGHQQLTDGIIKDGLWDVYKQVHMGNCAEMTAARFNITREQQDEHAVESYRRAARAWEEKRFDKEIVPVPVPSKKKGAEPKIVKVDEEFTNVDFSKISKLRPAFQKDGTVTAANASTLNDGASALVLATEERATQLNAKPLAEILAIGDAACEPENFTIAPSLAIPTVLKKAGLKVSDIHRFEINEAFSVVVRANEKILNLDPAKVNVNGGAVALGHPVGSSGSRILVTLIHQLEKGQYGVAAICNGGGAASSILVRKL